MGRRYQERKTYIIAREEDLHYSKRGRRLTLQPLQQERKTYITAREEDLHTAKKDDLRLSSRRLTFHSKKGRKTSIIAGKLTL
jgi:hypothetical protein